jgi:hypothetical protein
MSIHVSAATTSAAAASAVEECMVCCEPYNKKMHTPVECEYAECKYKVCIECVRAYLLTSSNEAHCMQCNKAWSQDFQVKALKPSWINSVYRQHRKKLLIDIEISKLPETMEVAARQKEIWREQELLLQLGKERDEINMQCHTHKREFNGLKKEEYDKLIEPLFTKLNYARIKIAQCVGRIDALRNPQAAAAADGAAKEKEKRVFLMPCPANHCKGLLSRQYKCGICELFVCPECHELIGNTKTAEHTCDPNNVASAQAIKMETKQCPGCPNRIYRIEGCSQMWCTGCHTAFDWNTGRVVKSERLHNPHWMEYQRAKNKGNAPMRAPGDIPCGGLIGHPERRVIADRVELVKKGLLSNIVASYSNDQIPEVVSCAVITSFLPQMYQLVDEVSRNKVRELRETLQHDLNFEYERCRYILNVLSKEDFATHVFGKHTDRAKATQVLHIYELFSAVGIDVFNEIYDTELTGMAFVNMVLEKMIQLNALRSHCNLLFAQISHSYNRSVPYLPNTWFIRKQKYNGKELKELLEEKLDHTIIGVVTRDWFERVTHTTGMYIREHREKDLANVIAEAAKAAELADAAIKEADETAVNAKEKATMAKAYAEMMKTRAETAKNEAAAAAAAALGGSAAAPMIID